MPRRVPKVSFLVQKTMEHLSQGRLHLKKEVQIIMAAYDATNPRSNGVRQFLREEIPRIQFKNPSVQMTAFKSYGPFPHLRVYFSNGDKAMIDCERKKCENILQELTAIAGKTEEELEEERAKEEYNPANFGNHRPGRRCICEIPGQVPCPAVVPIKVVHHWHNKKS